MNSRPIENELVLRISPFGGDQRHQKVCRSVDAPQGGFPSRPGRTWYLAAKHFLDFCLAIVLLVLTAPVVLCAAAFIKATTRGPVFYRQVRSGLRGRPFILLKLRTMTVDAESATGPVWSRPNDPRVTAIGRLLRQTHVDEFPQLWNVLRGEMSLVGPRPERPEFVERLAQEIPFYCERMVIRPGITGLAQLRLPPDTDLDSVRRKVIHDVFYAEHVSLFLDLKLLALTAFRLVVELGRLCRANLALPTEDAVQEGFSLAVGRQSCPVMAVQPAAAAGSFAQGSDPDVEQGLVEMRDLAE